MEVAPPKPVFPHPMKVLNNTDQMKSFSQMCLTLRIMRKLDRFRRVTNDFQK